MWWAYVFSVRSNGPVPSPGLGKVLNSHGRRGGLMVSALDFGSRGLGSNPS